MIIDCVADPILRLLTVGSTPIQHTALNDLNVKAVVAAFNQEKAWVGAFSMIVKTDGLFAALLRRDKWNCFNYSRGRAQISPEKN